ncbi:uncharacterized protein LOC125038075 [Penaeus chinensis]|uniref:uncharacterized protein LOC125038075 n=1 Tax=Penaeus chinensis TaxID=139456 RepID=UPI001FB5C076|nr:uncharacterized protein LOC125038075 [Penaeus chinensis]
MCFHYIPWLRDTETTMLMNAGHAQPSSRLAHTHRIPLDRASHLTSTHIPYKDSETPLIKDVWQSMQPEDFVQSAAEGVERVLKGGYAFMEWEIFYTLNYGHVCEMYALPEPYFPERASFCLAQDSPLHPVFNGVVLDLLSGGILTKWWQELEVISADCSALETAPIELKTVLTPVLLLALGMLVGVGFLGIERLASRSMKGV